MSIPTEFLSKLRQLDIKLWVDEGQLRVNGPDEALTPTLIAELQSHKAQLLNLLQRNHNRYGETAITPADRSQPLPLSFAQQRLWFLDQLGSSSAYNMPLSLSIEGPLNVTALQQTLQEIVHRHESLRTTFAVDEGTPYQVIHPHMSIDLPIIDLSAYAQPEQQEEVERLAAAEALRLFDLSRDPMLRATLLRLSSIASDKVTRWQDDKVVFGDDVTPSPPHPLTPSNLHILLLTLHHIAGDGWSLGVLAREMNALYAAFSQGQPSPLAPLNVQYSDFAVWQRDYLQGEVEAQQLGYWKERLASAPELSQLPTDHPRSAQPSFQGNEVPIFISADLTQQLRRLCQEQDVTLYMALLTAYQLLIYRYSGQTDIVVGSPIANRNRREIESLIGFFVNTLALRTDLPGADGQHPSFLELLAQVKEVTQGAYDHQDLPFERLVEELQPARNLNYNPLIQVTFSLQNMPPQKPELAGLAVAPIQFSSQITRFDLELHLFEVEDHLEGYFIYRSDLFEQPTIQRMVGHFQTLLAGIVAAPRAPITTLPLLTEAEHHQILVEWNATAPGTVAGAIQDAQPELSEEKCVHHLFEAQVERSPDTIAVILGEDGQGGEVARWRGDKVISGHALTPSQLTYRALNERANQLARHLQTCGAAPGTVVGICVERSLDMIVGLLGILKAGCVYVPLDPAYPEERLRYMLQDSQAAILLTSSKLANGFTDLPIQLLTFQTLAADLARHCTDNLVHPVKTDDLAYIIYTSGSTGQPKGVMIEHGSLATHIQTATAHYQLTANDCILQFASTSFDVSLEQIFVALSNGARLVVRGLDIWTPEAFDRQLLAHQITAVNLPPVYFHQLLKHWLGETWALLESPLRLLLVGGEKVLPETVKLWQQLTHIHDRLCYDRLRNIQLLNVYGPTETTITATAYDLADYQVEEDSIAVANVPIGKPLACRSTYILDAHLQPTPVGIPGELHIGGLGLARGYLNHPQLTQEKFIANPFSARDSFAPNHTNTNSAGTGRLYKTGDLCRYLPDGNIEFLGRIDNQAKLQGFRIELGEIERALAGHPIVQDVVVVARQDRVFSEQLVAYLVTDGNELEEEASQVETWQSLYEDTYAQTPDQADPTFNLTGWDSSYTGEPIPEEQMAEWVTETIADVRGLNPTRVWEIGCGTGLLLSRLAPACTAYWGTDYSHQALEQIARLKETVPNLGHVQLDQRMADDFTDVEADSFDCIILNSIIQYFPSVEYLLTVLEGAVRAVKPGGVVYVGDVRNLRLLHAYHGAVQMGQAVDELPLAQLHARIQQRTRDEEELLVDPTFFSALPSHLPQIEQVKIALKRGRFHNELTQFRYQVILHIGEECQELRRTASYTPSYSWRNEEWSQGKWTLSALRDTLRQMAQTTDHGNKDAVGLVMHNIPNARVQQATQLLALMEEQENRDSSIETVGQLRTQLVNQPDGIDPETLWAIAKELPYAVHLTWAESPGSMDACFIPDVMARDGANQPSIPQQFAQPSTTTRTWRDDTNNPLLGKRHRTVVPQARTWLQQRLPEYMIPTAFVLIEELPLSVNGKVDRQALPAPNYHINPEQQILPRTSTEEQLAVIWQEVLGVEQVGVTDNFFEIGGHSLLAIQIVSRIRQRLQVEVPLRTLFAAPTIAELSSQLSGKETSLPPIEPVARDEQAAGVRIPLSFAQQRLWILTQLDGTSATYNMPSALRLTGPLDVDAFIASWQQFEARHESLRASFPQSNGQAYQHIHPPGFGIELIELSDLPPEQQEIEITRIAQQSAEQPFELAQAPLWRAALLQLGDLEHILLLTMHHIISDGWSMNILARELSTLYHANHQEQPVQLPALPVQYADFAAWQHQWLTGVHIEQQLDYWRRQLGTHSGEPLPTLDLPLDFPRPAEQTYLGDSCQHSLSPKLSQALNALSQAHDATLFMTLMAAFNLLLGRMAGQEDILIGTPIAGRNRAEIEHLIGFFVNTLVLRTDLTGNPTFTTLLQRVKRTMLDAYDHQELPFEKLIEELQPTRDLSRTPLFQVWFNMLPEEQVEEWPDLHVESLHVGEPQAKFDLTIYVDERADGIGLTVIYNIHLFTQERIGMLLRQFQYLLEQIAQVPESRIQSYSLCAPDFEASLPDPAANLYAECYPLVHKQFAQQAASIPEHLAVVGPSEHFTYKELDEQSNQLAHHLIAQGVQPTDIVAIYAHRNPKLILALLGILKAGASFVVLDAAYPPERLTAYCGIAQPTFLIEIEETNLTLDGATAGVCQQVLSFFEKRHLCLSASQSRLNAVLKPYPIAMPEVMVPPDHPMYIAFTSGSTGQPNAVVGTHQPVSHFISWQVEKFGLAGQDRFTLLSGLAHDPLLRDIFTPLWVGATLYVPDQDVLMPGELAKWIQVHGVTIAHLTPQIAQFLTHDTEQDSQTVRYLFLGGDRLTLSLTQALQRYARNATVVNGYGATETPQLASYYCVTSAEQSEVIPIGREIEGVQLLVLNTNNELAGVGELGEIAVRTPYLSRGYLNDDGLTQAQFVSNPWQQDPDDRLYRTGDFGRYLPNGQVAFAGRGDNQLSIRGFRIEPAEIEMHLVEHADVQQAVVTRRAADDAHAADDESGSEMLVAYVVTGSTRGHEHQPVASTELRRHLEQKLPSYMIPTAFVPLESLPLIPNGKVDVHALPTPNLANSPSTIQRPRTLVEQQLLTLWEETLGGGDLVREIGIHDNFFELGGHSLLAIQLLARLNKQLKQRLPLRILFQHPTVAALTNLLQQSASQVSVSAPIALQADRDVHNTKHPPFYCLPGAGGSVYYLYALAHALGDQQPFYALESVGLDGKTPPHTQIEQAAAYQVEMLRRHQQKRAEGRPYYLGGHSLGGVIAFEVAQQLLKAGEEVGPLILLDSRMIAGAMPPRFDEVELLLEFEQVLIKEFGSSSTLTRKQLEPLDSEERLWAFKTAIEAAGVFPAESNLDHTRGLYNVWAANAQIYYAPRAVRPLPIHLFVATEQSDADIQAKIDGWSAYGDVTVHMVPGNHDTMLYAPHVDAVAQNLMACLRSGH